MQATEYRFLQAVREVIEECKSKGKGVVRQQDANGNVILWLEAEWVRHWNGTHEVIELLFCYSDTGRVAYGKYIEETMRPTNLFTGKSNNRV